MIKTTTTKLNKEENKININLNKDFRATINNNNNSNKNLNSEKKPPKPLNKSNIIKINNHMEIHSDNIYHVKKRKNYFDNKMDFKFIEE
jgi:hypothetical protein